MLFRVGLLPKSNLELVPFAYNIYSQSKMENDYLCKDASDPRGYLSRNFRDPFSRKVLIEFVGIW